MKKIVLFGDSLTQQSFSVGGFGQRLADVYQRRADILNRGLSGYNSRWGKEFVESGGLGESAQGGNGETVLATVFFGANDAADGRQHVPVEEYEKNIEFIVGKFKEMEWKNIFVLCPPCLAEKQYAEKFLLVRADDGKKLEDMVLDRKNELVKPYVAACKRVGEKLKVPVLDSFQAIEAASKTENKALDEYFTDGLHFSPQGNKVIFDMIFQGIKQHYPGVSVNPCKFTGNFGNSGSSSSELEPLGPWHDYINAEATTGTYLSSAATEPPSKKQKT